MKKLYVIAKTDFQGDELYNLQELSGGSILLIYGNIEKLSNAQKETIAEIQGSVDRVIKKTAVDMSSVELINVINMLNFDKLFKEKDATQPQLVVLGNTLCQLFENGSNKDLQDVKGISSIVYSESIAKAPIDWINRTASPSDEEELVIFTANADNADKKGINKDISVNPSKHKNNEVTVKDIVMQEKVQERKKIESKILEDTLIIENKTEIIDAEAEARAEYLRQKLMKLKFEIQKIVQRCKVHNYEINNDETFRWLQRLLQTNDRVSFNNELRVDINVKDDEYEVIHCLAEKYLQLCNQIY